jgi:hypothetical protein
MNLKNINFIVKSIFIFFFWIPLHIYWFGNERGESKQVKWLLFKATDYFFKLDDVIIINFFIQVETAYSMAMTEMNEQLSILRKFPFLIPESKEFRVYKGFIKAGVSIIRCVNNNV